MSREALQQALDALPLATFPFKSEPMLYKSDVLAALAQPEQEPVAWMTINGYGEEDDIHYENPEGHLLDGWTYKPLYTHPPTAQPEEEPLEYWNAVEGWVKIDEVRKHFDSVGCGTIYKTDGEGRAPLYTSPPKREWVGLTYGNIWQAVNDCTFSGDLHADKFARAIEAKLKKKNT
jgi:hypothetical protein